MHEDHDGALLRRMADGDESALAALYDGWAERVHTLAFWILKDPDEAEDVVEETFWQVWRTASRKRQLYFGSVEAWSVDTHIATVDAVLVILAPREARI